MFLLSTQNENVITMGEYGLADINTFQLGIRKEADIQILLHVAHYAKCGIMKIMIHTVNAGVVIITFMI